MKNGKIQFMEVFKEGWKLTKENLCFLCVLATVILALSWLGEFGLEKATYRLSYILGLSLLLAIPSLGMYRSAILIMNGIKPKFDQLYCNWKLVGSFFLGWLLICIAFAILSALIVFPAAWILYQYDLSKDVSGNLQNMILFSIGAIAGCIPVIWALVRFGLFPYFIVDKNNSSIAALKGSYGATRGNVWPLLKFYLVSALFGIVGMWTFGLIGIITWPLMTLVLGIAYRKLTTPEVGEQQ